MFSIPKVVFALLTIFCINSVASFYEEGSSRRNCDGAKTDAMQMAKSTCLGLDTQQQKAQVSDCKKDKQGYYKVKVTYKCDVEADNEDGYQDTIDEDVDTYL